jgi:hypothetical protein
MFGYVCQLILKDDNIVSRTLAAQKAISTYAMNAYLADLITIYDLCTQIESHGLFEVGKASFPFKPKRNAVTTFNNLSDFYAQNGYGMFIGNSAFTYERGELLPILNPSTQTLNELKNYESEKKAVEDNILSFLNNLPYENMLLYGERGTGKSSTVHAVLNKYVTSGLRLIELDRQNLVQLPELRKLVSHIPLKFLLFIDDLSFDEYDERASFLKAALEGSMAANSDNLLIIATSNRRHIVKETFSDRENAVHAKDSLEEQLSLSDRFGLTVYFSTTDKAEYLSIVKQLAADKKVKMASDELCALAERWALVKGGRSPRRAKQFVDLVFACEQKGTPIDF